MDINHNGQWKIAENKVHTFFFNLAYDGRENKRKKNIENNLVLYRPSKHISNQNNTKTYFWKSVKIRSGTTTLFGDFNLLRVCVFPGPTRKNGLEFPALTAPLVNYFIYVSILITVAPNESLGYKLFNGI